MKKTILSAVATVGLVALGLSQVAYAEQTRALPDGETLYAIDCEDNVGQLVSVDVATGELTAIGEGTDDPEVDCAADAAWDPNTNIAYWVDWGNTLTLWATDVETGVPTNVGPLLDAADETTIYTFFGLFMGVDGVLWGMGSTSAGTKQVFTIDTATGLFTIVADVTVDGSPFTGSTYSTSFNPADDTFYFIDVQSGAFNLYSIDLATGAATLVGPQADNQPYRWYGLTFDSNGTMWSTCVYGSNSTGFDYATSSTIEGYITDTTTFSQSSGATLLDGRDWFSESNFITYQYTPHEDGTPSPTDAPASVSLASTGVHANGALGAMGALMVAGLALIVIRARRSA
ncbi:MAG TPA: LPXTG cell wall anchor domain-containing protein [Microbacteriaceae bacterium]|nr:LPXTG cell wall anchor domain-containing protein [Microbacteriaceae bacterium]